MFVMTFESESLRVGGPGTFTLVVRRNLCLPTREAQGSSDVRARRFVPCFVPDIRERKGMICLKEDRLGLKMLRFRSNWLKVFNLQWVCHATVLQIEKSRSVTSRGYETRCPCAQMRDGLPFSFGRGLVIWHEHVVVSP